MKTKSLHLLASALLLAFASCTSDLQELNTEQSPLLKQIVMTTEDFEPEAGSRTLYDIADGAVQCTWDASDTVGVFPDEGAQAYFPMKSGEGAKNATFTGGGWALKDGSMYGAYYPFISEIFLDKNAVPVSYTGQTQTGNGSMAHLGDYDYMVATPTAPEFGSVQFMFKHLSALVQLKITVPEPATLTSVKLVADTEAFAVKGTVDILAETPCITAVTSAKNIKLDLQDVKTTEANQVVTLYLMLPPADLSAQTLKAVIASDKGNQEIALESKNFQAGKAYALSGEMEAAKGSFEDGVVSLAEAGTMKKLLGSDYLSITSLKVVGLINGDDVRCLRQMLGAREFGESERGKLETLDLLGVRIVEGGDRYFAWYYSTYPPTKYFAAYYTANDEIGACMFYSCANLKEIVLPDGATSIGDNAFCGCSALTSIDIPDNVTSIGDDAFYDCYSLTTVTIGDGVTSIGNGAFDYCSALTSIDIPDGVTSIGNYAFCACDALTTITIGDGVTSIGDYAFSNCSALTSIDIPDGVTSIGNYAFRYCSALTTVTIGDNVTSIGSYAFWDCPALTDFYCHATTPPSIEITSNSSFPTYGDNTTLHVPERCRSKYKLMWGNYFMNIVEMD